MFPTDQDWLHLLSEEAVAQKREAAEQRFRDLTSDQISHIRRRAKNDLFFLATGLLEYDLLTERFHGHYCRWLEATRGRQYRMTLQPRGHYKTTINTISDSIQIALPNDAGVQAHPYCLGPNVKILLAHENRESASRFLFEIAAAFLSKPAMLAFFPDCIPSPRKQRINKWELELPRGEHHKEPTFDTIGAGGAAQGRHFHWLKLDDLIGEKARDSETVMQSTLDWFDNADSLLTRPRLDGWDLVGTHWSASDLYSHAIRRYGVDKKVSILRNYFSKDIERMPEGPLAVYGRSVEEEGEIVFPEEFTAEKIAILRKNPRVYAAQYANNPKDSSLTLFQPSWIKLYNVGAGGRIYVFTGESSFSVDVRDLDRVIMIDPSVGETKDADESGFIVTGTDNRLNIYVLEAYRKRLKPPELIDEMFRLYTKWWPRLISIESVAFSAALSYWFTQKCNELRIFPSVYPYKPGSQRSKRARIEGLTTYFAAGQVYILEGMNQLRDELEWFPLGDSDHLLDALAQGPEVWAPSVHKEVADDWREAEIKLLEERDMVTGY